MTTFLQIAAVLVIAVGVGILIGTGLTTRSIDQSFRRLAQQRRVLHERERAIEAMLAQHRRRLTYSSPSHRWREPAYLRTSHRDFAEDDD